MLTFVDSQYPDAKIAITEDADWISVISEVRLFRISYRKVLL